MWITKVKEITRWGGSCLFFICMCMQETWMYIPYIMQFEIAFK